VYLGLICAFHVIIGVGLNAVPDFPRVVGDWYGAERVNATLELMVIGRALGAFMFILGVLAAVAALDPLRHRAIVYGFAGLFALRAAQRLVFGNDQTIAFGIPPWRVTATMGFFFVMAITLAALYRFVETRSTAGSTAGQQGVP
jgi:hypothetical protein